MSRYHPGKLAETIDAFQKELGRWAELARSALRFAEASQRRSQEACTQASRKANLAHDQALRDVQHVRQAAAEVSTLEGKCDELSEAAAQATKVAQQALRHATATLATWKSELQKALAWLERALARLARAQQALSAAQAQLSRAESELSSAGWALSSCESDSKRNCSSERSRVSSAEIDVSVARGQVRLAEAEVKAAEAEVKAAQARVACCERAVSFAEQALEQAKLAEKIAAEAVDVATRSTKAAGDARNALTNAQKASAEGSHLADEMVSEAQTAQQHLRQAAQALSKADRSAETAQNYVLRARWDLSLRVDDLRLLNRATLDGTRSRAAAKSSSGSQGSKKTKPARPSGIHKAKPSTIKTGKSRNKSSAYVGKAGKTGNSKILGKNMEAAGMKRPPDTAAHHIVATGDSRAQQARELLKKFKIDINDAKNGVFLPHGSESTARGTKHQKVHTGAYFMRVNSMLARAGNSEEALQVLETIRKKLLAGKFPL